MAKRRTNVAKPVEVVRDGTVEVFEIYSPKLGRNIKVGLNHARSPALLSDEGIVMMVGPDELRNIRGGENPSFIRPYALHPSLKKE